MATELKKAKLERRTAKAALTRSGNWLTNLIKSERQGPEVSDALDKVKEAFGNLTEKHESFAQLIEDDEEFENEEHWMEECQSVFMELEMQGQKYLDDLAITCIGKGKGPLKKTEEKENFCVNEKSEEESPSGSNGMIGMSPSKSVEISSVKEQTAAQQSPSNSNGMIGMTGKPPAEINISDGNAQGQKGSNQSDKSVLDNQSINGDDKEAINTTVLGATAISACQPVQKHMQF